MDTQFHPTRRDERLLTDVEACEYLRIRNRQLYAWRMQGLIPFIRIGRAVRYRQSELDAALDSLTVTCSQP
jgi:excisionase family DNA binding protein